MIETVEVGQRVAEDEDSSKASRSSSEQYFEDAAVHPENWREIELIKPVGNGSDDVIRIRLLRTVEWIHAQHAFPGNTLSIEVPELGLDGPVATHEQARAAIFEYIEVFYNRKRLHSSLGYISPEAFEARRR